MGKIIWNEKRIAAMRAEGRGEGTGKDYLPWLTVRDLSSIGTSRRVFGVKIAREHHLFSDVEWALFLLLEWSRDIVDIREQFPLDRALTQEIAQNLGISHPCYPGTRVPVVMTVDFFVTRLVGGKHAHEAFNAKRAEEAEDPRSVEKLEIQRYYFEGMQIPHRLVLHSDLPSQIVKNIEWIRGASERPGEATRYDSYYAEQASSMLAALANNRRESTLAEFCEYFEISRGLAAGDGLRVARQLMLARQLIPNLEDPNLARAPLAAFSLSDWRSPLTTASRA